MNHYYQKNKLEIISSRFHRVNGVNSIWGHVRFTINQCKSICLPNQEASTEVSESVSLTLCSLVLPVRAGMTMLGIKN